MTEDVWINWEATKKSVYRSEHSAYGRHTNIELGQGQCEMCQTVTTIMAVDSSQGEYCVFDCCFPCLEKLWKNK